MDRLNPFRVVGFAFLAFAAFTAYHGEFQLGRSGGLIINRAQDPDSFWRYVLIQAGIGLGLLYLSRQSRPLEGAPSTRPVAAEDLTRLPNYDPVFCGKIVKGASFVCASLAIAELLVVLLVHPSNDRCPHWVFHPHQPSAASLWVLAALFTVLPACWICYVALRWDRYFANKMYNSILYGSPGQLLMPIHWLLLAVIGFWCLICAVPLFLMLGQCTELSGYLNLNGFLS